MALIDLTSTKWAQIPSDVLQTEIFGPALCAVNVPEAAAAADDAADDVDATLAFVNKGIAGSLSCTLLSPASADPARVERLLQGLEYGAVALNAWSVFAYQAGQRGGTWGAFPGDYDETKPDRAHSGVGRIGNIYGIKSAAKTIVRGKLASGVDLSTAPPAIVFDILNTALVKNRGGLR